MTGNIRDTEGGIVSEQTARDGHRAVSHVGRSVLRLGICISVLVLAGSLFAGVAAADPIEIGNWTELQGIEDDLNGDYVLVADLDANTEDYAGIGDDFQPIGFNEEFTGSFNGSGHTISDLVIDQSDSEETPVGLFGHVGGDGEIHNVALVNANVTGDEDQRDLGNLEDRTGALVGFLEGTITHSSADATVVGGNRIGGLVGVNDGGDVSESYATGEVDGRFYAGGLIGWNSGDVSTSYATGEVDSNGGRHVGGLVGWNSGDVSASYATGEVYGGYNLGGLVGWNDGGTVSESYATGDVGGAGYVGGLVGWNDGGTVSESYATGDVGARDYAAGLVGWNDGGTVSESYATGETRARFRSDGGLVARNSGTVSASYWDTETTGQSTSTGSDAAYGLTTAEMTGVNATITMAGFDFYETWVPSASYPEFAWDSEFDWSANFVDDTGALALEGEGTESSPYVVTNVYELQAINADLLAYYVLDGDVDASVTEGWNDGKGFEAIGDNDNRFEGTFNGSEYTISNLTIRSDEDYVGLFGAVGDDGKLTNVSLEAIDIEGNERVGGLVGQNKGSISHSYATGSVDGSGNSVGGLVGLNGGTSTTTENTISHSYSAVSVDSSSIWVGGLVGQNAFNGEITESYASGTVNSPFNSDVGGLIGTNGGEVTTSYATGSATGSFNVGGLIGRNSGTVEQSYASGSVEGSSNLGGLIGTNTNDDEFTDSYWDIETTGQTESDGGTGLTTLQITGDRAVDNLFDFGSTWEAGQDGNSENGRTVFYPVLQNVTHEPAPKSSLFDDGNGTETAPYQVSNWYQLDYLRLSSDSDVVPEDAHFELTADLDEDTFGYEQVGGPAANDDEGFDPIGVTFSGHFNGSGHTISDLYINRSNEIDVGLFRFVNTDGTIENVGLENVRVESTLTWRVGGLVGSNRGTIEGAYVTGSVEGEQSVGGLVGENTGTVNQSYATGSVEGSEDNVGGLVGSNRGTIEGAYATGSVDGDERVGGLVGDNRGTISESYATSTVDGNGDNRVGGLVGYVSSTAGSISNSYAIGSVNGIGSTVGGLVGENAAGDDDITDSFWNTDTTGQSNSAGGTGLSTAQMTGTNATEGENMGALDFTSTWAAADSYPLLTWSISDLDLTLADDSVTAGQSTDVTVTLTLVDSTTSTATTTSDYSSDDTSVATVDAGTVTAAGAGSATLTAEIHEFTDIATISVAAAPASPSGGGAPPPSLELSVTEEATVEATNGRAGDVVRISPETTGSSDSLGERGSVGVDSISVELATDRDFWMSVDTFERGTTSPGGTDEQADDDDVNEARSLVSTAFETDTSILSAGYVTVTHNLEPEDVSNVTFEFSVQEARLDEDGLTPESITLHRQSDGWAPLPTEHLETNHTEVRFEAISPGFSSFAIGTGEPLTRVTGATLAASELIEGDIASVTATVENRGEIAAEHTVELTANGETVATETLTLGPGETDETTLSFEPSVGAYDLAVDGTHVDSLAVAEASATDPPDDDPAVADDNTDESVTSGVSGYLIGFLLIILAATSVLGVILWRKGDRWSNLSSK